LLTAALGFALVDTKGKPTPKEVQTHYPALKLTHYRGRGAVAPRMGSC
jgi:hypothetical protein